MAEVNYGYESASEATWNEQTMAGPACVVRVLGEFFQLVHAETDYKVQLGSGQTLDFNFCWPLVEQCPATPNKTTNAKLESGTFCRSITADGAR